MRAIVLLTIQGLMVAMAELARSSPTANKSKEARSCDVLWSSSCGTVGDVLLQVQRSQAPYVRGMDGVTVAASPPNRIVDFPAAGEHSLGRGNVSSVATVPEVNPGKDSHTAEMTEHAGVGDTIIFEIEFELNQRASELAAKNKFLLGLIELLGFGFCGFDRCFMGQFYIGLLKACTVGGLGVWALIDLFGILFCCLSSSSSIDWLGYHANFSEGTVVPAFVLVFVVLMLMKASCCYAVCCVPKGKRSF